MTPTTIYLVDENDEQRRAFTLTLNELLRDTGFVVEGMVPLKRLADYATLLADGHAAALILDQRMEDGGVDYTGTMLSGQLRAFAPKLPIFILSAFTDDAALFEDGRGDVEDIVPKKVIARPTEREAQVFKARFLRRVNGFVDLVSDRATRYHDLLVKSLRETLTPDEERDLGLLEVERILPQQAKEIGDVKALEAAMRELRERLHPGKLPLE